MNPRPQRRWFEEGAWIQRKAFVALPFATPHIAHPPDHTHTRCLSVMVVLQQKARVAGVRRAIGRQERRAPLKRYHSPSYSLLPFAACFPCLCPYLLDAGRGHQHMASAAQVLSLGSPYKQAARMVTRLAPSPAQTLSVFSLLLRLTDPQHARTYTTTDHHHPTSQRCVSPSPSSPSWPPLS